MEVPGSTVNPAVEIVTKGELPTVLENTLLYDSGVSGMTVLRVHKKTPIYVAASWNYDGNSSGQWTQERWMKEDFEKHGWEGDRHRKSPPPRPRPAAHAIRSRV